MASDIRGHLLCLTSSFPRWANDGTQPFVLHLAQDLQQLGWAIDVLAPHAPGAAIREDIGGVTVERFCYLWPRTQQTVCYGGGTLANLRNNAIDQVKVPFLVASEWIALTRRLRHGSYDLLHSHSLLPQGLVGAVCASGVGIPHVATIQGSDVFELNSPTLDPFKKFALRRVDGVTVNSSAARWVALNLAPDLEYVETIPVGTSSPRAPELARVESLRAQHRRGAGPLLLHSGRLVWENGLDDIISAVERLSRTLPDCTALLVGEGADRMVLEDEVKRRDLSDRISFAGWVPSDALIDYYTAADMVVAPAWFDADGSVIAEAMMAGKPVIATDAGGIRDTIRDGHTGLLVPPKSPRDLAAAVERLHHDTCLGQALSIAGRGYAKANLMRAKTASAFSHLFDSILRNRARPRERSRLDKNSKLRLNPR